MTCALSEGQLHPVLSNQLQVILSHHLNVTLLLGALLFIFREWDNNPLVTVTPRSPLRSQPREDLADTIGALDTMQADH